MALGIYEDTGSFLHSSTCPEDLSAAAWLLRQGANLDIVTQFVSRELSAAQISLIGRLREQAQSYVIRGVTVVISTRPQQMSTPTAMPELILQPGTNAELTAPPSPLDLEQADALSRAQPPLAKDLFPMGVRVIAVQGLPVQTDSTDENNSNASFNLQDQPQMLILLVPNASREVLSLALQQGDSLVVSLMARGDETPTAGFTYWDFEDLFKQDREDVLGGGQ